MLHILPKGECVVMFEFYNAIAYLCLKLIVAHLLMHVFVLSLTVTFALNNNNANVEILSSTNFKRWKDDIEYALGIVDINLALREDKPDALTAESTTD